MTISDKATIARLELELAETKSRLELASGRIELFQSEIAELRRTRSPEVQRLKQQVEELKQDAYDAYRARDQAEEREGRTEIHYTDMVDEALYLMTKLEQILRQKLPLK